MVSNSTNVQLTFDEAILIKEHLERQLIRMRGEYKELLKDIKMTSTMLREVKRKGKDFQASPGLQNLAFNYAN